MYVRIFIRPKMETYLFPAITVTRNSSFSPRLFVILQFRAEALLLPGFVIISDNDERAEDKTKKKTSKNVPKNSNDLKCFAGQVFVCGLEQWHRKFINEIFALDGRKEERERGQQETIFSKQKKRYNDKPEPLREANITQFLGCPFRPARDRIFPSRMMETCNVIQHACKRQNGERRRRRRNARFLVSRGDDDERNEKYIKFYCFLPFRGTRR